MKKRSYPAIATVIGAVVLLASCDAFNLPLTDSERMNAFLETANESTRDYDAMQSHFSETAPNYLNMNTSGFWESTILRTDYQTFSVSGATEGGEVSGYPGSTSISGTLNNSFVAGSVTFVFVEDSATPGNRVIRAIDYNSGGQVIQNRIGD